MLTEPLPPPFAPPGWYADPYVAGGRRWWDGQWWTEHASPLVGSPPSLSQAGSAPAGSAAGLSAAAGRVAEPQAPTFPLGVGLAAIAILYASLLVERLVLTARGITDGMHAGPLLVVVVAIAYGPSVAFSLYAAVRWGNAHPIEALGARLKAVDFGWGPATWVAILTGQIAVGLFIRLTHIPTASNLPAIKDGQVPGAGFAMLAVVGIVVAPIAEELVFRGVVLRSFRSHLPLASAAVAQGAFFAMAHVQPAFGWGNIGLFMVLLWAGSALGVAAGWFRRIWPGIFAHAMINSVAFLVLYGQTYWHWRFKP